MAGYDSLSQDVRIHHFMTSYFKNNTGSHRLGQVITG